MPQPGSSRLAPSPGKVPGLAGPGRQRASPLPERLRPPRITSRQGLIPTR